MKVFIICLVLFVCAIAHADSVNIKDGNVFYESKGLEKQITSSGRVEEARLHPNGEWIYFVREDKQEKEKFIYFELWRVNVDGTNSEKLFRNTISQTVGDGYDQAWIGNIQFSPLGDKVYFEASQWATSAGLHVINPEGTDEKLLGGGNDTRIILEAREVDEEHGNLKGYIVTNQHRYWWFGGSYDWYWLFTPDFKEVGPLGDDLAYFTQIGEIKYTDQCEKEARKSKYVLP